MIFDYLILSKKMSKGQRLAKAGPAMQSSRDGSTDVDDKEVRFGHTAAIQPSSGAIKAAPIPSYHGS